MNKYDVIRVVNPVTNNMMEFVNNKERFGTAYYQICFVHDRHTDALRPTCMGVSYKKTIDKQLLLGELLPGSWIPEHECPSCTATLTILEVDHERSDKRVKNCEVCGYESKCYTP